MVVILEVGATESEFTYLVATSIGVVMLTISARSVAVHSPLGLSVMVMTPALVLKMQGRDLNDVVKF